jgi:hypothetical protein
MPLFLFEPNRRVSFRAFAVLFAACLYAIYG